MSYNESASPFLGDDGANLASVIGRYLKRGRTDIVDSITVSLKTLVPPYLLDHIPIQSVICMHVAEDGYARAKPLSDHPEYDHWKDVMTAGEFWSSMGEERVTQGEKVITPRASSLRLLAKPRLIFGL